MCYHQRRIRLTASNFGNLVNSLLYSKSIESSSLRWGKVHEPDAREAYKAYLKSTDESSLSVFQSGLVVDYDISCLACSPDGLVGTSGLVEYKCPYKAAQLHLTPLEASNTTKDFCATSDGQTLHLKFTHHYFYQVQGCLAITKRNWCDFVIWTPQLKDFTLTLDSGTPQKTNYSIFIMLLSFLNLRYHGTRANNRYLNHLRKRECDCTISVSCVYHVTRVSIFTWIVVLLYVLSSHKLCYGCQILIHVTLQSEEQIYILVFLEVKPITYHNENVEDNCHPSFSFWMFPIRRLVFR